MQLKWGDSFVVASWLSHKDRRLPFLFIAIFLKMKEDQNIRKSEEYSSRGIQIDTTKDSEDLTLRYLDPQIKSNSYFIQFLNTLEDIFAM